MGVQVKSEAKSQRQNIENPKLEATKIENLITPPTSSHSVNNKSKSKSQKSTSNSQKSKSQKVKKSKSRSPKSISLSQSLKPKTKKTNIKRTILKMTDKDKTILKNTFNNITDYLCP